MGSSYATGSPSTKRWVRLASSPQITQMACSLSIFSAMAKNPAERYSSAADLVEVELETADNAPNHGAGRNIFDFAQGPLTGNPTAESVTAGSPEHGSSLQTVETDVHHGARRYETATGIEAFHPAVVRETVR